MDKIQDIIEEIVFVFKKRSESSSCAAINYLRIRAAFPQHLSRESILKDHKYWSNRATTFTHKDASLQQFNRDRASATVEAITMLGKRISSLDNAQ